ncbi:MAG: fibronectin type III domain-containing protein [Spirochaetes bacterium]|nr:fibronectin type III domain-containing protein [Spirochaetota bacterium]
MRKNILSRTAFIIILVFCIFYTGDIYAEYIFLKDGKIIQGTIIRDEANMIAARVGKETRKFRRSEIIRILYTDLNMGKVYIQKRDGTSIIVHIVDEDRTSYVCRKELYSPEEFTLKRSDVLFVAEKNPSGLQGQADMTWVKLTWFPPYDPVSVYNIYIREGRRGKYEKIDHTSNKEITIKGLKSNTEYYFIVKSVDRDNYESPPSNEIKLTTKNIPPLPPKDSFVEQKPDGSFILTWPAAVDPDGTIKEYKIYKIYDRKTSLFVTTTKTEYIVSLKEKFDRFFIKSIDNLNTESVDNTPFYFGPRPEINIAIQPVFAVPMGNLGKLVDYGYGVTLRGGLSNYYLSGLDLKLELSYIYFKGKSDFAAPENSLESIVLAPALLSAGYSFYPFKALRISPALYFGICYVQTNYTYFDIPSSSKKSVKDTAYEPVIGAGLSVRWDIAPWFVGISADYRYIFEESENIVYWSIGPFAGVRF